MFGISSFPGSHGSYHLGGPGRQACYHPGLQAQTCLSNLILWRNIQIIYISESFPPWGGPGSSASGHRRLKQPYPPVGGPSPLRLRLRYFVTLFITSLDSGGKVTNPRSFWASAGARKPWSLSLSLYIYIYIEIDLYDKKPCSRYVFLFPSATKKQGELVPNTINAKF